MRVKKQHPPRPTLQGTTASPPVATDLAAVSTPAKPMSLPPVHRHGSLPSHSTANSSTTPNTELSARTWVKEPGSPSTRALLLSATSPTRFASSVPETKAIVARRVELRGAFHPAAVSASTSSPTALVLRPAADAGFVFGGQRYIELPNSTALTTTDPRSGRTRELVLTRGVRPYENEIDAERGVLNGPRDYVSDVLLFERQGEKLVYVDVVLRSAPEHGFLFEDPRISAFVDESGARRILLSGTDYSPHVAGATNKDVMNRYVELTLDGTGLPQPVAVDATTKRPSFRDLSPRPRASESGHAFVDAKNAVVAVNEDGHVVVRTRFRPSKDDPAFAAHPQVKPWGYGEQVFEFASFADLQRYDWGHALDHLVAATAGQLNANDPRPMPLHAACTAVDDTFHELYPKEVLAPGKGKGFGPGTPPVRVRRAGDELFLSEGKGASERSLGRVPTGLLEGLPIDDGGVVHLTFDHEIRYCVDHRLVDGKNVDAIKRVYSASIKLWDRTLTRLDKVYADVVQPLEDHQRGGSGILDLHHTYPMGRVIVEGAAGPVVRVVSGESDAHTASCDFDVLKLLVEMARGGERERSGQVYAPSSPRLLLEQRSPRATT